VATKSSAEASARHRWPVGKDVRRRARDASRRSRGAQSAWRLARVGESGLGGGRERRGGRIRDGSGKKSAAQGRPDPRQRPGGGGAEEGLRRRPEEDRDGARRKTATAARKERERLLGDLRNPSRNLLWYHVTNLGINN
jgi:hypothetical protein